MNKIKLFMLITLFFVIAEVNAGPAPGITYLKIKYVYLSNRGWVPINDNQFFITRDRGASALAVFTVEVGYGFSPIAKMNSTVLPASTLAGFQPTPFCSSNYLAPCKPGQTVIGWTRYWFLNSNNQTGQFYYQNTSSNVPFGIKSDQLSIY